MSLFACIGVQAEFTESVDTVMTVRSANGEEIGSPEELSAGEYNVILNIGNLTHEAKKVEVYVAVKVSGKLYSVKSRTTDLGNKDLMQVYPIEIPVTLAKDVSGKEISIEAYCWDDTMVPFNRKTVFGDAKTEIYTAYGRITATSRSNGNLDYGEVKFCVEKSNNFDGDEYGSFAYAPVELNMYYANQEAYNEMFRYSKATIIKDVETEDFTIVSLEYMDSESTVITECSLYEIGSATYDEISFYTDSESSTTNTYDISTNARVYINGVGVTWSTGSWLDALAYIESNDSGKVTLIDVTEIGKTTTDGKIDYIFVDYYVDGIVDSVVDGEEYKIYFENGHVDIKTLKVDTTDEDMYTRYILDGEDNNECPYYVINDQKYSASKLGPVASDTLTTGNDYILWLNAFGFFVKYDEDITNKNIGIFDMAYIDSNDVPKIRLITKDGEKKVYPVKYDNKTLYMEMASQFYTGEVGASNLKPIQQLLCEYTVNSKGYITSVTPMGEVGMATAEYSSDTKAFGAYELAEDAVIIDLSSISNWLESGSSYDVNVIQKKEFSQLVNYMTYEVVVCDKNENGKYNFAVILSGGTGYTGYTPIAVYTTSGSAYDDIQGTTVNTLEVYINGNDETVSLKVAPGTNVTLNRGDVFLYKTDSNGYVDSIFKLFGSANESSYSWFMDNMTPANMGYKDVTSWNGVIKSIPVLSSMPDDWINTDATTKTGEVDLIYGVITDKRNSNISISSIEESSYENNWGEVVSGEIVNVDTAYDYTLLPDANVYVYDYFESKQANRVYVGNPSSVVKSQVPSSQYIYLDNGWQAFTVMEDESTYRELNFIFAKLVDGDIAECLVILGYN